MWKEKSNPSILKEIGKRIQRERLRQDITQACLAESSGVSLIVVQRIEKGMSISLQNLLGILRALNMLEGLEQLFPEPPISPILLKKLSGKTRKRASKTIYK
jgi:transcriptional regulator, XRE family